MSTAPILRTHPLTGAPIEPIGRRRGGRPVWPILGGAPDDWPAFMPGREDDPGRAQAATLLDEVGAQTEQLRPGLTSTELSPEVVRLARAALGTIGEVRQHTHSAAAQIDAHAANDLIPAAGRDRLLRETQEASTAALRELQQRSEAELGILEKALTAEAQPAFPAGGDRAEARERFRMLADAAGDPSAVVRALVEGRDAELAAVASSSYARTYLESRGVEPDVIAATAQFAVKVAASSGDPLRKAAAAALANVHKVRKTRAQAFVAADFAIGWDR